MSDFSKSLNIITFLYLAICRVAIYTNSNQFQQVINDSIYYILTRSRRRGMLLDTYFIMRCQKFSFHSARINWFRSKSFIHWFIALFLVRKVFSWHKRRCNYIGKYLDIGWSWSRLVRSLILTDPCTNNCNCNWFLVGL